MNYNGNVRTLWHNARICHTPRKIYMLVIDIKSASTGAQHHTNRNENKKSFKEQPQVAFLKH